MKITKCGSDYVRVDEDNLNDRRLSDIPKIHIIELSFRDPTTDKVNHIINSFKGTNRFVISDNIRFYNNILRNTSKKYYVSNRIGDSLISFYRKNNKVLLDTTKLTFLEQQFVFSVSLRDILLNTEVMITKEDNYKNNLTVFNEWSGNLIFV